MLQTNLDAVPHHIVHTIRETEEELKFYVELVHAMEGHDSVTDKRSSKQNRSIESNVCV